MVTTSTRLVRLHGPGYPRFRLARREEEAAWHDADHRKRFAVQREVAIDNRRIAIEAPLPERIAQNNYMLLAYLIFSRQKRPAERRRDAENREDIRTHELPIESFRLSGASQIDIQWPIGTESFERLVLVAKIEEVRGRCLVLLYAKRRRLFPHRDESLRISTRQWSQQDRINCTKNRGIDPTPQRERHERDRSRPG